MNGDSSEAASVSAPLSETSSGNDTGVSIGPAALLGSAAFWDFEAPCEDRWLARAPLLFWLIDVLRPRRIAVVGDSAGSAFLAACQAVGRLRLDARVLGAFIAAPDGLPQDDGWHGVGTQHRLGADAAQSLLVREPVDMLVLDTAAGALDGVRAPERWLATLTGARLLVLEGRTADSSFWSTALAEAAGLLTAGAHVVLPEAAEGPAVVALRRLLRDPGKASDVRHCLERLGAGLCAGQAARAARATAAGLEVALAESAARGDMAMADLEAAQQQTVRLEADLQAAVAERNEALERLERLHETLRDAVAHAEQTTAALGEQLRAAEARAAAAATRPAAVPASSRLRWTRPLQAMLSGGKARRVAARVRQTGLFDDAYYRDSNPDIAGSGMDGALHFALHGWKEGRKPSRVFDPAFYLDQNPDVRAAGVNPLFHYVQHGRIEGRQPLPGVDVAVKVTLERIEVLEQRAAALEAMLQLERGRIDWALGGVEGVMAHIDAYHADRETDDYRAAYGAAAPLVSVCVATLDRADLLIERAVASLRAQTYRNLQIVVVGDNCVDDTAQRLAALRDDRIQFVNLPQRGPYPRPGIDRWHVAGSNAMNHALTLCEGQFVTHLDDDDVMVPHRIEKLVGEALQSGSDFLWHAFWYENRDGTWVRCGNGRLELGQVSTGSIFYHRYFTRFPWDVHAYRLAEPGDWNRLRKIKLLRPRTRFVDEPLLYHYAEQSQPPFIARDGEQFLE